MGHSAGIEIENTSLGVVVVQVLVQCWLPTPASEVRAIACSISPDLGNYWCYWWHGSTGGEVSVCQ